MCKDKLKRKLKSKFNYHKNVQQENFGPEKEMTLTMLVKMVLKEPKETVSSLVKDRLEE